MREVDQILARAYALQGPIAKRRDRERERERTQARPQTWAKPQEEVGPPRPHFPIPDHPVSTENSKSDSDSSNSKRNSEATSLAWPAVVEALEREHGQRFEQMADALIEAREHRHLKVLLFTSCHRSEGRTTLILTLARALARRPGRILLADADLTGPMLARQLQLRPKVGLDDVVEQGAPLADALVETPDERLTLLPLRAPVGRPRDFLAGAEWACLMARLRREFDLVLLDGSPLFAGLSAAVLHRSVDATVLVHSKALTGERALLRAREVLDAGGVPLLGVAETFV